MSRLLPGQAKPPEIIDQERPGSPWRRIRSTIVKDQEVKNQESADAPPFGWPRLPCPSRQDYSCRQAQHPPAPTGGLTTTPARRLSATLPRPTGPGIYAYENLGVRGLNLTAGMAAAMSAAKREGRTPTPP